MATPAVLRSKDCLRRNPQFNHTPKPHFNRSRFNPEFNTRRNDNKNRIPVAITSPKMVMGEVKILKRGDPLPEQKKIDSKHPVKKTAPVAAEIESEKKIKSKPYPVRKKTAAVVKTLEPKSNDSDLVLGSATRLGPEPEMVQMQIKVADFNLAPSSHFYAGSGPLLASPHPSSLPLPLKLTKNKKNHSFFP